MITKEPKKLPTVMHSFPGIGEFTSQTIKAYQEANWLASMLTTIVIHKEKRWVRVFNKLLPQFSKRFKNRNFSEVPAKKIKLYPFKEIVRLLAVRYLSLVNADKVWEWAELSFDKWAARQLSSAINVVHAYEHAALATFIKAKKLGIYKILEQTSQHYVHFELLINSQFEKYPELRSTYNERISGNLFLKRNERKKKEHDLADLIICNSTFTKRTLILGNVDERKIIVIPLAFPEPVTAKTYQKNQADFIFLYAGSLNLNKGTHILLNAWEENFASRANLKLILIGKNSLPIHFTKNLSKNIQILDFIPQSELNEYYDQANVFVFPTLADGFGMVITEAMSRGLPVIAGTNSAGPDLIEHQQNGLIVNSGDKDDLIKQMNWCLENKSSLPEMGNQAFIKAKSYQWADYRKNLIAKIYQKLHA